MNRLLAMRDVTHSISVTNQYYVIVNIEFLLRSIKIKSQQILKRLFIDSLITIADM